MLATIQPNGIVDVILWPLILTAVGIGIFVLGARFEYDDGPAWIKWLGAIPLLIALFLGWPYLQQYIDSSAMGDMYREMVPGNRMLIAHWGAVLLPVLALLGMAGWSIKDRMTR